MLERKRIGIAAAVLLTLVIGTGCKTGENFTSPQGPRYSGGAATDSMPQKLHGDTLTIVTFNIKNGVRIDSAIVVLQTTPELRDPDFVMLQEVDEAGTQQIAHALHMSYVYYPAAFRKNTTRNWGNAVVTRWPVTEDAKLVLPHVGRWAKTMRAATAATVRVGDAIVRVYSAHLGTLFNVGPGGRRDQLRAVLADAGRFPHVIVAGDMNSSAVGEVAKAEGYAWPTLSIGKTNPAGRLDHVFLKGFVLDSAPAAAVHNNHHASDHKPVWARAILKQ